jgi:hypothetical protein
MKPAKWSSQKGKIYDSVRDQSLFIFVRLSWTRAGTENKIDKYWPGSKSGRALNHQKTGMSKILFDSGEIIRGYLEIETNCPSSPPFARGSSL